MFQRIKIENFLRIPYLDVQITAPVLLVAGHNEAGKSTLAESIRFVIRGDNPRIRYKKDYGMLVTNGAKRGSVEVAFNNNEVKRNIRDGAVTGDSDALPTDTDVADICLGAIRFVDLAPENRRALLMRVMGGELTKANIYAELKERGFDEKTIRKYEPLYANGVKPAYDKADRQLKEKRGAWKEVTGENYGPAKADGWTPPDLGINVDELNAGRADLDAELAALQSKRDEELAPVNDKIREIRERLSKPQGIPCPKCGAKLTSAGGELMEVAGISETERKTKENMLNVQQQKAQEINAKYRAMTESITTDLQAIATQIRDEQARAGKQDRAAEIHGEIKELTQMRDLFGDSADGILARFTAKAIKPFNERMADLAGEIGWMPITLGGDMSVSRVDQVPYELLSESAQWRADALLHVALSEFAQFPWIILDRMDVLVTPDRVGFIKWADTYGGAHPGMTMIVCATLKARPSLESLESVQVLWLEEGMAA